MVFEVGHFYGLFGLFLTQHTFLRNFLTVTLLMLISSGSQVLIVGNICAKGIFNRTIFSLAMGCRSWNNIKERCRRKFPLISARFFAKNHILLKKLCDFKKKITSIRPTVQKLCNFFEISYEGGSSTANSTFVTFLYLIFEKERKKHQHILY